MPRIKPSSIQVGDRFVKAGDSRQNVWVVMRSWTHVDGLVHVQLAKEARLSEVITVSAFTLADDEFFEPVGQAQPQA